MKKPKKQLDYEITDISDGECQNQRFALIGNLAEAKFDAEARTAEVTVIQKGWSKNGFYYGTEALESIVVHLNSTATRVFLDHNKRSEIFEPRKTADHIANNIVAKLSEDGNRVIATAKYFSSGPNAWVFERMKETPETFGPSIVGQAKVKKGEAEGRKGPIVHRVSWLHSYDMVASPSAGGKTNVVSEADLPEPSEFIHIYEGFAPEKEIPLNDDLQDSLAEAEEKLAAKIKRIKDRRVTLDKWYDLESTFDSAMGDIILARGDYTYTPIVARKKLVVALIADFQNEVAKLKFIEPKPKENTSTGEAPSVTEAEPFNFNKGVSEMTLAEMKAQDPSGYANLVAEARKDALAETQVQDWKAGSEKLSDVQEELTKAKADLQEAVTTKETLEAEKKALTEQVTTFESKVNASRKAELIAEALKEAKLEDTDVSETFRKVLEGVEFDPVKESEFKTTISEYATDRKEAIGKKVSQKPVKDAGAFIHKDIPVSEGTVPDNKSVAALIKG